MRSSLFTISVGLLVACAQHARGAEFITQVLADNPVGFWILNDAPEATTTAKDSSVTGFHGTYEPGVIPRGLAGPSWVPGPGLVADFTGGTISFPTSLDLGGNGYTIQAWIRPSRDSLDKTSRIVASGNQADGYGFGTAEDGGLIFTTFAQLDYETTGVTLLAGRWYYVGVVMDAGNDANFYVNGSLVETVAGIQQTHTPTGEFTIGHESPGIFQDAGELYTGGLAGVSVYETALTSAQIQAQFDAAVIPEPSSLVLSALFALGAGYTLRQRRTKAGSLVPR